MSKIQVDAIEQQSGTTLTTGGGASKTVVVDATTVTLGRCGGTVALASGASQTGFGRTGTVDWITTVVTSTPTTGVSGKGYFIDSTGGVRTVNLPASPSAGDIMSVSDYAQTAATNNITIGRNGSNIQGSASDLIISNSGASMTLVYVDGTKGWIVVNTGDESDKQPNPEFIIASGGTEVTSGNFKTHVFTGPGTFTVSCVGNPAGSTQVDYVILAGGGGAGTGCAGGAGGAGGFRESHDDCVSGSYTASPLATPSSVTVTAQGYPVVVGGGGGGAPGPGGVNSGCAGSVSSVLGLTSAGGGFGGYPSPPSPTAENGSNGGSGGGGAHFGGCGGSGNTPPVSPPQGQNGAPSNSPGGSGPGDTSGGGGGAGGAGLSASSTPVQGGPGVTTQMVTATYGVPTPTPGKSFASGGGGGTRDRGDGATPNQAGPNPNSPPNAGLFGGGGSGGYGPYPSPQAQATGGNGSAYTGGGGGAGTRYNPGTNFGSGGSGGSGIVMIRYKFQ